MSTTDAPSLPRALPTAALVSGNGNGKRRRHGIQVGIAAVALTALAIGGYWFWFMRGIVYTDDARLAGHLVDMAPEITGRLVEIAFREGRPIRRGDALFRLDPASAQATLAEAEASLLAARANLASCTAKYDKAVHGTRPEEIRSAAATTKRLATEEEMARINLERTQTLFTQGSAAQDELDRAKTACEAARQSRVTAEQNLALLQAGSRVEDVTAAKADVEEANSRAAQARAAVEHARTDLDHCAVKAPFDGWVVRRWVDAGAITPPGQPVLTIFDPSTLRVDANIEEKYLHEIRIGDEADVRIDAFPHVRLKGRVIEILRATNSQFSLIPAEGVSGTFIKVTQRVPLRIAISAPADLPLGPGLSVEVKIHVGSAVRSPAAAAHAGT
jgi:membrane fusion protein (multidrug efflux system)